MVGWQHWTHGSVSSLNLFCPDVCKTLTNDLVPVFLNCCFRRAKPYWRIYPWDRHVGSLSVEYSNRNGIAEIIDENQSNFQFYKVVHQNGFLSEFPYNTCNFSNIVEIDFAGNCIETISKIHCLLYLDELHLERNKIKSLQNTTFSRLPNLRKIYLNQNCIHYIEPRTFLIEPGSLMHVDVSKNKLESTDVTNVILGKKIDRIDYSHNKIEKIKNEINWACCNDLQDNEALQGGFIDLSYNNFKHFPNFTSIGFNNSLDIARIALNYGINIRHNSWYCDCFFLPLFEYVLQYFDDYSSYLGHYRVYCSEPDHLKNYMLIDLRKDDKYDLLICNLTLAKKCPVKCSCYFQPSRNRTVVDCSGLNITVIKNTMPDFDNLEIDFSNNNIVQNIVKHDFFSRITKVNLANNSLVDLDFQIFDSRNLRTLNLLNNPIKTLRKSIQNLYICAVLLGNITMKCDCDTAWLKPWLLKQEFAKCGFKNIITCETKDGIINAMSINRNDMCSSKVNKMTWVYLLLLAATFLLVLWYITVRYRFECFILSRKMIKIPNKVDKIAKNDAYISFDEDISELRCWITKYLLQYLELKGYKIVYPLRDFRLGHAREEEACQGVRDCSTYIIFLSQNYLKLPHLTSEWKYIWNSFAENNTREIIVINYDDMDTTNIEDDRMKALIRVGYSFDFFNMKKNLISDIEKRLRLKINKVRTGLSNRNIRFINTCRINCEGTH